MEQRELFYLEYKGLYFASMYITVIHNLRYLTYRLDSVLGKDNYKIHISSNNIPDVVDYNSPFKTYDYFYKFNIIKKLHKSLTLLLRGNLPNKKQFEDYCNELKDNHTICITICNEDITYEIYLPYQYSTSDFMVVHSLISKIISIKKSLYTTYLSEVLCDSLNESTNACLFIGNERITIRVSPKAISND